MFVFNVMPLDFGTQNRERLICQEKKSLLFFSKDICPEVHVTALSILLILCSGGTTTHS
jgi:hypothetical protein